MSEQSSLPEGEREWFSAFRRAHTGAALGIVCVVCILFQFLGYAVYLQYALAGSFALFLSLPHVSLDQYSAFIVMQPRFGKFWPLGFLVFYSLAAVSLAFAWLVAPGLALLLLLAMSTLHFGLGDVDDCSPLRWLEILTRGSAPLALGVLFHAEILSTFAGWLILDIRLASIAIYDYAIPAAIAWQLAWAIIVIRYLWQALAHSSANAALIAAEMSVLVLAFAVLPPLIAFVLYASLLHAPRHIIDFAERNPQGVPPMGALWRVVRGAAIPTAMSMAGIAFALFFAIDSDLPQSHILRLGIWIITAFSLPHMILSFLAIRPLTGLRRVPLCKKEPTSQERAGA
jgi:Brp/Blh family beta-carotene 15,15'-monooxygenase